MTINTCLSFVDGILPNAVPRATKCRWLGELEGRVRVELLGNTPEQQTAPDETADGDTELSVPFPYDQIYWMYLTALLEYARGDSARYEIGAALFNAAYRNYAKYLVRTGAGR